MTNGVIKGDGTSRLIKTVADFKTLYPTYEDFAEALVAGTVSLDILFNAVGWSQLPTFLNQANLFSDENAASYGLSDNPVINEAFARLLWLIPDDSGIVCIKTTDEEGNPQSVPFTISPAVNGQSTFVTDKNGVLKFTASAGSYTLKFDSAFTTAQSYSNSITITAGSFQLVSLIAKFKDSGEIIVTSSKSITIPSTLTSVDLFVVGGGGSGAAVVCIYEQNAAGGGAGGYTKTLLGYNAAGKTLTITVGAGGTSVSADSNQDLDEVSGKPGGTTTIEVDGSVILSASGGRAGLSSSTGNRSAASGGSDGGSVTSSGVDEYNCVDGGEDGSPGQGTTTRAFGESSGTLYASGGGVVAGYREDSADPAGFTYSASAPGGSGAGNGTLASSTNSSGESATTYGSGGGPILLGIRNGKCTSGAGKQGIAIIRWGS